jgi:nitrite reductase/ring-hydroxylating ferredoxin subunit
VDDGFVRAAALADVPPGACMDVEVDEQVLVLTNVEGEVHALSGWCTHQGTALVLGRLSGHTLTCYAHLWSFDVRSGEAIWPPMARVAPGYNLRVHRVRIQREEIWVARLPGRGR